MAGEQETFLSHLVELRDRLIRVLIAVGIAFVPLAFYARELYSLLAAPLLATLPAGGQMIATDVVGIMRRFDPASVQASKLKRNLATTRKNFRQGDD